MRISVKNSSKQTLLKGTLILTLAGIITRLIGFIYKIYLADILGAKLLGIYQLIFPVYGLCFTIYGAGIQTAISQLVASYQNHNAADLEMTSVKNHQLSKNSLTSANKTPDKNLPFEILFMGMALSVCTAFLLSFTVFSHADFIAKNFVLEPSCTPYLKILSTLFPFCSISACICGYYYAIQNASVPAISQIIEQLSRIIFVFALCSLFPASQTVNCQIVVWGMVVGEICGCMFNVLRFLLLKKKRNNHKKQNLLASDISKNHLFKKLFLLTISLTSTKLVISILHSVEAFFLPAALKNFGYSPSDALSINGVFFGMALPFILFPTAITSALSVLLLPAVAKAHSEHDSRKIKSAVSLSSKYSLLIGWLFTCIFLLYGNQTGTIFFHSSLAGNYIKTLAWLCPFLYISTTFTSIINGLGHTQYTFFITTLSLLVKIYALVALVPKYGMTAYLTGTLISQALLTLLAGAAIQKYLSLDMIHSIFLPCVSLFVIGNISVLLYQKALLFFPALPQMSVLAGVCIFIITLYAITLLASKCISLHEL